MIEQGGEGVNVMVISAGGDIGKRSVQFSKPLIACGIKRGRRTHHKDFHAAVRSAIKDVGKIQAAARGGQPELEIPPRKADHQSILMRITETPAGFILPAGGKALSTFHGAGERETFHHDGILGCAGQDSSEPTQGAGIPQAREQFISYSCDTQLPVFHGYLFTLVTVLARFPDHRPVREPGTCPIKQNCPA